MAISPCSTASGVWPRTARGSLPRREPVAATSRPDLPVLERWLRHWSKVRHREAAERTLLTAIAGALLRPLWPISSSSAATDRVYADEAARSTSSTRHSSAWT